MENFIFCAVIRIGLVSERTNITFKTLIDPIYSCSSGIEATIFSPLRKFQRRTLRSETIFGNRKSFKNDEKCFLLHLKSSFRSQDI